MEIEILDEKNKMQHTPSQYHREFVNKRFFFPPSVCCLVSPGGERARVPDVVETYPAQKSAVSPSQTLS